MLRFTAILLVSFVALAMCSPDATGSIATTASTGAAIPKDYANGVDADRYHRPLLKNQVVVSRNYVPDETEMLGDAERQREQELKDSPVKTYQIVSRTHEEEPVAADCDSKPCKVIPAETECGEESESPCGTAPATGPIVEPASTTSDCNDDDADDDEDACTKKPATVPALTGSVEPVKSDCETNPCAATMEPEVVDHLPTGTTSEDECGEDTECKPKMKKPVMVEDVVQATSAADSKIRTFKRVGSTPDGKQVLTVKQGLRGSSSEE